MSRPPRSEPRRDLACSEGRRIAAAWPRSSAGRCRGRAAVVERQETSKVIDPVNCSGEDPQLKVLWGVTSAQPDDWSNGTFDEANNHGVVLLRQSANGADEQILKALTPEIAILGTGDPARTDGGMNAFSFGHPRASIIDALLKSMTRPRTPVDVPVARGAKNFENVTIDEAIYATGWDGTIVVTAKTDGTYRVVTAK